MKKFERISMTKAAYELFDDAMNELNHTMSFIKPLRSCQATVYEITNFYLLKSYDTFVAAIDKHTGFMADVLRTEYGYTATSAQHISKFFHDYSPFYDRKKVLRAFPEGD